MSGREESRREDIKKDVVRLHHMLDAAKQILLFTESCSLEDFEDSEMLCLAVVRLIEIIEEAANQVTEET